MLSVFKSTVIFAHTNTDTHTNSAVPGVKPIPSSQTADAVLTVAVRPEGVTT